MDNCKREEANSQSRSTERGVSVVEVIIVAVIIGILTVVAIPAGIRQMQLYRLDTTAGIISSKLMEARMNAIKRNRSSTLRLYSDERRAEVRSTDNAGAPIIVGFSEPFAQDVTLQGATVNVDFDSLGRLPSGIAQRAIVLREQNSGSRKNVVISPAGRVTVSGMY